MIISNILLNIFRSSLLKLLAGSKLATCLDTNIFLSNSVNVEEYIQHKARKEEYAKMKYRMPEICNFKQNIKK